jgi:hypothetical protein
MYTHLSLFLSLHDSLPLISIAGTVVVVISTVLSSSSTWLEVVAEAIVHTSFAVICVPSNHLIMDDSFDPTFLTTDVDVDFEFLRAQIRHPDDNYWISDEQVEEITADRGDFPTAGDWKDDAPDVISNTEVSIDKARRHLWKQAKTEIGILRTVWEEDHPSFDKLATRIFGPKSKLFQLLIVEEEEEEDDDSNSEETSVEEEEEDDDDEAGDLPTVQVEYRYADDNSLSQKMTMMNLRRK